MLCEKKIQWDRLSRARNETHEEPSGLAVVLMVRTATKPSVALKSGPPTVMLWLIPSLVLGSIPETYLTCVSYV
jgi:hypothetical protein